MSTYMLFALLGLGSGALYALLGQGIAVTYRATGVINLAHGAIAATMGYVYAELHDTGRIPIPPVPNPLSLIEAVAGWFGAHPHLWDVPTFVGTGGAHGVGVSIALTLVVAAALGAGLHVAVFRPLRFASPLTKMVAGIGILLALQAFIALRFGPDARRVKSFLPHGTIEIAHVAVPVDRLLLAGIAVTVCAALVALFRFTRYGLAARAAAHDEAGAVVSGLAADRLAMISWVLATELAAVAAILISPITTLSPANFTLFVVPALGAVLASRLDRLWLLTAVALVLGMLQSLVLPLQQDFTWLPKFGLAETVPLIVIAIVLVVLGGRLPTRGSAVMAELPRLPRTEVRLRWVVTIAAVGCVLAVVLGYEVRSALIASAIGLVIALSVVVVTGLVGQISLMPMAFAGVTAVVSAKLSVNAAGLPSLAAAAIGVVAAMVVGLIASIPSVRSRSFELAIITLAAGFAFQELVLNNRPMLTNVKTAGSMRSPSLFGAAFGPNDSFWIKDRGLPNPGFAIFVIVIAALCAAAVIALRSSALGRRLLAVRSSELAASAVGVDPGRTKMLAFVLSAGFAGIAGALVVFGTQSVSPSNFVVMASITTFALAYLGGVTGVLGAWQAALLAPGGLGIYIADRFVDAGRYQDYVAGVALIVVAIVAPAGLAGALQRRRRSAAPSALAAQMSDQDAATAASSGLADVGLRDGVTLSLRNVSVSFGGVHAVRDVSTDVRAGELTGLIGSNGAGKTTLIDAITGHVRSSGAVGLGDEQLSGRQSVERARAGVVRTFQQAHLFADLSVRDNLRVAKDAQSAGDDDLVEQLLDALHLRVVSDSLPEQLSLGQQRLVSVGRALAASPRVLLLDEPAAGLDASERTTLMRIVVGVAHRGLAVVIIDHDTDLVFAHCDRVLVLDQGTLIADGTAQQVRHDPLVAAAYLGAPSAPLPA